MIGGTGLLGSASAFELINRGHIVKTLALPPLPVGAPMPKELEIVFGNYLETTEQDFKNYFKDCDCFIFAAGVDERIEFPPPVYEAYYKYNIAPLEKIMKVAKECGVKKAVIMGSYFSYFAKEFPNMKLTEKHPYIRSRIDQEKMALSFADNKMSVAVLELPYIFGTQSGRKPVWTILVEQIQAMKSSTMWATGGTTMVTVKQVAETVAGAAELSEGAQAIPVGWYNMQWKDFLKIVHIGMGVPERQIKTVPKFLFKLFSLSLRKQYKLKNIESGLDPVHYADLMYMETFIDNKYIKLLGVKEDDIETAIKDSIKLSVDALGSKKDLLGMKGE